MLNHIKNKFTLCSYIWLITLGSVGCDTTEDQETRDAGSLAEIEASVGDATSPREESMAGQEATVEAGDAAGNEEALGTRDNLGGEGTLAGTQTIDGTTGEAGSEQDEAVGEDAGSEVIIEVAGELAEEWEDPDDFGTPGEGIHAFTMVDINGEEVDMRRYRGRVVLVVNVASRCGYTRQYEGLQTLYNTYRDRGLIILGFPANNFGGQEPGTEEEIAEFCEANYGVTFPLFSKVSVTGTDIHPLYEYLTESSGQAVSWNFNKFLVGTDGVYVQQFTSQVEPLSPQITGALEPLLTQE